MKGKKKKKKKSRGASIIDLYQTIKYSVIFLKFLDLMPFLYTFKLMFSFKHDFTFIF